MKIVYIAPLRRPPNRSQAFVGHDSQPVAKLGVGSVNDASNDNMTRTSWCMYLRDALSAGGTSSSSSMPMLAKSWVRSFSRLDLNVDKKFLILSGIDMRHGINKCQGESRPFSSS